MTDPIYVRLSQAQKIFGMHRSTFYRAAKRGEITIYKRGGASILKVEEIRTWIEGEAA